MEGIMTCDAAILGGNFTPQNTIPSRTKYTIEIVVMLLYMMCGLNLLDIFLGLPGGIFQIGINLFLVYHLKQFKSWAWIATLIRSGAGIVANFFILGIHNPNNTQITGLTIVFLLYAIIPLLLSAILIKRDVKWAFSQKSHSKIYLKETISKTYEGRIFDNELLVGV